MSKLTMICKTINKIEVAFDKSMLADEPISDEASRKGITPKGFADLAAELLGMEERLS